MARNYFEYYSDCQDTRLDHFLTKKMSGITRSQIQKLIRTGYITVNGQCVKAGFILDDGDKISGYKSPEELTSIDPEDIPLEIIYEDKHLVIINKPSGLIVHPGTGNKSGTLVNGLVFHFNSLSDINAIRPGIVHRLDKETTGIMVVAKTNEIHDQLAALFRNREIKKTYKAITWGKTEPDGIIETSIGRHPQNRTLFATDELSGRYAKTSYKSIGYDPPLSYLSLYPKTGRTHQIRVHLQSIGHPIIADNDYSGGEKLIKSYHSKYTPKLKSIFNKINRVALHAHKLEFIHPVKGKKMQFEAPIPEDFTAVLKTMGLENGRK